MTQHLWCVCRQRYARRLNPQYGDWLFPATAEGASSWIGGRHSRPVPNEPSADRGVSCALKAGQGIAFNSQLTLDGQSPATSPTVAGRTFSPTTNRRTAIPNRCRIT